MPTGRWIAVLPDVPDGERRDGRPQRVVRGEHPVIPMPVLPRRRHGLCHGHGSSFGHSWRQRPALEMFSQGQLLTAEGQFVAKV
jgi:hypothetical protein